MALLMLVAACATSFRSAQPLRLSELGDEGDATRRASMGLIGDGLDSDERGGPGRAVSNYERAIQVDPNNPWAYLAMARHYVDAQPRLALDYLDRAEVMLESEPSRSPRVEAHLIGLRGAALSELGRSTEGRSLLEHAAHLAPTVWGDGHLSARELR
jgi:tetratricopeptide (TPR) repeat protein